MSQENIKIVMVGSLYGGNVGSACRAMANMGISSLRLVSPAAVLDWSEATKMAVHADAILGRRETFSTLAEAVADCVAVVGTTARHGLYRQTAKTPRDVASEITALSDSGPVALVFGREDKGLLNDEIALCTHLVQIPTSTDYSSLNLAQAIMVLCYELFITQGHYEPVREKAELAPAALRERLFELWRDYLLEIGFMETEKADHMMAAFNRIFSRGALTDIDVNILMGVVRQSQWAIRHKRPNPAK